ncbi:hypothetical protein SAMN05192534_11421 [Alteribacillus persepolensis]|uniref:Uncharacterized protein n=1 Tax=Alteribacillus persepolensis TaxID=568899 RepID=A0A1G8G3E1_9BACI|nr:hypothetical protein [Alteribacillus persepolensis]SDH88841.1 hypothetical protein SAMN05192534_11421 [Alteribacillus persepolensis]
MSNSKGNKAGYVKGLGRTFAPSLKADWVDEFNQILEEHPEWSRNRLTEHFIQKGLDSQRKQRSLIDDNYVDLSIPADGLTEEQQSFLTSEEGKIFVGNAIKLLLMQPGSQETAASSVHLPAPPKPAPDDTGPLHTEPEERVVSDESTEHDVGSASPLPKRREKETKLSPLKRAKNKLKRQNLL